MRLAIGSEVRALLRLGLGLVVFNGAVTKIVFDTDKPEYRVAAAVAFSILAILDETILMGIRHGRDTFTAHRRARKLPPETRQMLYARLLDLNQQPPRERAKVEQILRDLSIPPSNPLLAFLSETRLTIIESELSKE
jgi:hypothetical protein